MRCLFSLAIIILIGYPVYAGIDNYLFKNKQICQECIEEIRTTTGISSDESYECKGRFGDKPGHKFYVQKIITRSSAFTNEFILPQKGKGTLSTSNQKYFRKQSGLNESEISKLCPQTVWSHQ